MVIVKLKNPDTGEERQIYIDGWLKRKIDAKVLPAIGKRNEDFVMLIDGKERYGKSTLAQQIGAYVDPSLIGDLSRVCLTPEEIQNKITGFKGKSKKCVIYDEAGRGMSAKGALSEVNKILSGMMQEMGQKNLFVIIVMPTFFELQKYQALFRARVLIHTYKNKGRKGFWRFIGSKDKTLLYLKGKKDYSYNLIKSKYTGRFYKGYMVDEDAYEKKKSKVFSEAFSNKKSTKEEKFKWQRDKLLYILYKECGGTVKYVADILKLHKIPIKRTMAQDIIKNYREDKEESLNSPPENQPPPILK